MPIEWRLEDLYKSPGDCQLHADLAAAEDCAIKFREKYKGKVSEESLRFSILEYEKIIGITTKVLSYAFLRLQTNLNDDDALSFYQHISEEISKISSYIVFFGVEISELDKTIISTECSSNADLGVYKSWFLNCIAHKNHLLSKETEEAVLQKQLTANESWVRFYDELVARMEFIFDGNVKRLPEILDIANHSNESTNREKAARIIGEKLSENSFYIGRIYGNILLDRMIDDRLRKFDKPESFRHLDNDIDQEVVDFLVKSVVEQYQNTSHKYYKLKAKLLKKKKLEYWDRNAKINLSGILQKKFDYRDAVQIVLPTLGEFSETFVTIARKFVENGWIDVYPKDGKTSGAFSHGCSTDVHPYILLNHFGEIGDVFTLAHELGHGIHQTLSAKNGPLLSKTPITMSEVASLFSEKLIFDKIFETSSNNLEKIDLMCLKLDSVLNSVIRQIAFFKFERLAHDSRRSGNFSTRSLSDLFMETQVECLGDHVNIDNCIACYWGYISHFFHAPFYVYAYAFGELFVNALINVRKTLGMQFVDKYIYMLSRGGIDRYDVAATPFGLVPAKLEFWETGVRAIVNQIQYLEELCDCSISD
jgi:oligoendopeptidase F